MGPGDIIVSGGLWLAVPIALAAGLLSFLSPCVLPLVPGYLGYVSGVTSGAAKTRSRVVLGSLLFVAGFSLVAEDFLRAGEEIAAAGLPTVFVFEGGYAVAQLGVNVANVLDGFAQIAA